jgi:hypothetical protein
LLIKLGEPRPGPPREEEVKIKSNFGESNTNDFYSKKYKGQKILFGEDNKEAKMRCYEVFQVEFEE